MSHHYDEDDEKKKAKKKKRSTTSTASRLEAILEAASQDGSGNLVCPAGGCARRFFDASSLEEHAEAVHTFNDIERLVGEAVREKYGRRGDYRAEPPIPSIYAWVNDMATDWVVFTVEGAGTGKASEVMYKAAYTVDANNAVTLGDPVEVVRRTVYEEVTGVS